MLPDSAFLQGEPFYLNTIAYNSNEIGIAACLSPPPLFLYASAHVLLRLSLFEEMVSKAYHRQFPQVPKGISQSWYA